MLEAESSRHTRTRLLLLADACQRAGCGVPDNVVTYFGYVRSLLARVADDLGVEPARPQ